jgi:hypothetical protein
MSTGGAVGGRLQLAAGYLSGFLQRIPNRQPLKKEKL